MTPGGTLGLSRRLLGAVLQSLPDGVIVTDHTGRIILINRRAASLTGWRPEEAIGQTLDDVFVMLDERAGRPVDHVLGALADAASIGLCAPATLAAKDGTARRIAGSVSPLGDGLEPRGSIVMFREHNGENRTDEAPRRSEECFREYETVFHGTQDALFLIDVQDGDRFLFRRNNRIHADLTGCTHDRSGMPIPLEGIGAIEAYCRRCLAAGAPVSYEETRQVPGGERTWHTTLSPIVADGRVVQIVGSSHDVTDRKHAEAQIRYLSFHDKLTGLHNRAYLEEELERLDTERELPLSVIMGDANGLKLVNDAFGHVEGDKLLARLAEILRRSCRPEDVVARWGGDEFVLLLPRADDKAGLEIAERIRQSCAQADENPIRPSIALGVATKVEPGQSIYAILKEAEDWMYRKKLIESKCVRGSMIASLRRTLSERTFETSEHVEHLRVHALAMGRALRLSDRELDQLALLAMLHDIGKIAIPAEVINKPGRLSRDELAIVRKHPEVGCRIARSSYELAHIAEAILAHHEHWDGRGYTQGRKGAEIPLVARILSVVDAFDVMITGRPYKKAVSPREALSELKRCAGAQFDPELVELFVSLIGDQLSA